MSDVTELEAQVDQVAREVDYGDPYAEPVPDVNENQPDLKQLIEQDRHDRIKVGTTRVKAVMHELGLQFAVFAVDPDNIPVRIEHALDPRWRVLVNLTVKD